MEKELPDSWVEIELGNILKLKNGYAFKSDDFKDAGIPVIRISNIQNELVQTENAARVDQSKIKQEFVVQQGDILIAMSGATTGKYGIYNEEVVALQNQRVGNLIPHDESLTSRKLILYLLGGLKKEIEEKAYGGAQPNISPKLIEEIRIGFPPLPEQQRIVAKLNTLFGHIDALKTRLDRIPQLLKDFRQKVLTQAVTGKLTEEWREGKKLEEWNMRTLGEFVIKIQAGKNFNCPEYPVTEDTVGLVKISAVTWGKFDPNETKTVLDKSKIFPELFIKKGDFLMSRANTLELVGASLIVDEMKFKIMLSDKIWRVTFKEEIDKRYVDFFLKSSIGRNEIESRATGNQLSMRNISHDSFKKIDFNYPSIEEQQEIISRVESLFAKADQIEASYQKLKAKIEQLPQAMLAKAFRGELVEQLPTDGNARELLEQIKRAKEGMEKGGKGRKMKGEDELRMVAEDGARYGKK